MKRMQLFELEDFPWFSGTIRNLVTDYLGFLVNKFGLYRPVLPRLGQLLQELNCFTLIDLGSGGSGPVLDILKYFNSRGILDLQVVLTDFYPHLDAFKKVQYQAPENISFVSSAVDARLIPTELKGFRTFFNTFHHFNPLDARHILTATAESRQGMAAFELAGRDFLTILFILLSPLIALILTPLIKPLTLSRFILTYIIPIIPFIVVWDGIISNLRTYSPAELNSLTGSIKISGYKWEYGRLKGRFGTRVTYLLGYPEK